MSWKSQSSRLFTRGRLQATAGDWPSDASPLLDRPINQTPVATPLQAQMANVLIRLRAG